MLEYDQIKASQMRSLTKHLPLNSLGLPLGYWRPDLLPLREETEEALGQIESTIPVNGESRDQDQLELFNTLDHEVDTSLKFSAATETSRLPALLGIELPGLQTPLGLPQDVLDSAFVPLSYEEGYPALPSGWPFWEQLPFESPESHIEFKRYLDLGKTEFRILPNLAKDSDHLESLNLYSALYYWPIRARCYDLFYQASRKREREALIYDLELDHLKVAQKYRSQISEYMDSSEFQDLLTPMVAVNLLKLCWQMERVSAGLPLNGANSSFSSGGGGRPGSGDVPVGSSLELVMRQMIRREREAVPHEAVMLNERGEPISPAEDAISAFQDRLLQSPELVELAQELVLKLTRS